MIEERRGRKILICDSCARQIVNYNADNEFCIGPIDIGVMITGINKHACYKCIPYERQWEQMCIGDDLI